MASTRPRPLPQSRDSLARIFEHLYDTCMTIASASDVPPWEVPALDCGGELARLVDLLESVAFEDGLAAAMELVERGACGFSATTAQLAMMSLLAGDVAARLRTESPFDVGEQERFFMQASQAVTPVARSDANDPVGDGANAQRCTADEFADVAELAHGIFNQVGAVRASAVAEHARWDDPPGLRLAPAMHYPLGHVCESSAEEFAIRLRLGTFEAQTLVSESAWLAARVPRLLERVGAGESNLATAATIGRELQDARPETCERVEEVAVARGIDQRPRSVARRSTRVVLERVEASAARTTARRSMREQVGVWVDSHPTPGLAQVSAVMPVAEAEALICAVEAHAQAGLRAAPAGDDRLIGERRVEALMSLALRNVSLVAHLDVIVPPEAPRRPGRKPAGPAGDGGGAGGGAGVGSARRVTATDAAELLCSVPVVLTRSGAAPAAQLARLISEQAARVQVTWSNAARVGEPRAVRESDSPDRVVSTGYRPAGALRDVVVRRDGRCRFPGCSRPGRYTDLDHVIPWPRGQTVVTNLQCLCRRHHRAKHARWAVEMTSDGTCRWTARSGAAAVTVPQLHEDLADLAHVRE